MNRQDFQFRCLLLHVWCIKIQNFWGRGRVSLQFFWCLFLHWDGSYATYCTFLSNIRASLGFNIDCEKIIFGTDEKTALINAIKTTFPNSEHILCVRHIQENAHRNILKQNVPEKKNNQGTALFKNVFFKNRPSLCRGQGFFYLEREQEILDEFTISCGSYISNSEILNF